MKSLLSYILEYKTNDEICIYQGSHKIKPSIFAYDKESLDNFIDFYKEHTDNVKFIKLCHLNGNQWKTLQGDGEFDFLKPNDEFYKQGSLLYTYQELLDNLDNGKYILILLNKQ